MRQDEFAQQLLDEEAYFHQTKSEFYAQVKDLANTPEFDALAKACIEFQRAHGLIEFVTTIGGISATIHSLTGEE